MTVNKCDFIFAFVLISLLFVCRVFLKTKEELPKQRVPGSSGYGTTLIISILEKKMVVRTRTITI